MCKYPLKPEELNIWADSWETTSDWMHLHDWFSGCIWFYCIRYITFPDLIPIYSHHYHHIITIQSQNLWKFPGSGRGFICKVPSVVFIAVALLPRQTAGPNRKCFRWTNNSVPYGTVSKSRSAGIWFDQSWASNFHSIHYHPSRFTFLQTLLSLWWCTGCSFCFAKHLGAVHAVPQWHFLLQLLATNL